MLYKVDTTSLRFNTIYVEAKNIDDCLYKIRKYLETKDVDFKDDLILRIELIKKQIVK